MKSFKERLVWRRALDYLDAYQPLLIGVTGSIGKTTTKRAIGHAIALDRDVYIPEQSYHTPLGVARGILGVENPRWSTWFKQLTGSFVREIAEPEPDTIVLEVGATRPGDIDDIAQSVPFRLAVVTNVGTAHTDLFHSQEMVAHEMTSLVVTLPKDGVAILNADDPLVAAMAQRTEAQVELFGQSPDAQVRLVRFERLSSHGFACEVNVHGKSYELHLPHIIARQQLPSVLAAITVAHILQLDLKEITERLQSFKPLPGRLVLVPGQHGAQLLDDSFDATPESMLASIETLRALPATRRIAILGDITNLAGESDRAHRRIGKIAGETAHMVIAVGNQMRTAGAEAIFIGADVHHFDHARDVGKWLADYLQEGDVVLVSGSKDMKMSEVVTRLKAQT